MTNFNHIHVYGNLTYTRESQAEREIEVYTTFWARDEEGTLGLQRVTSGRAYIQELLVFLAILVGQKLFLVVTLITGQTANLNSLG